MLKLAAKKAILRSRIVRFGQSVPPRRAVILRYHSVRKQISALHPYISDGITHTAAAFREQMKYLASECNVISLEEVSSFLSARRKMPERAVAVTFDDGFRDNYEVAAPILEDCGLHATFYVSTSSLEGRPLWIVRLRYWSVSGQKPREEFLQASQLCASSSECRREAFLATLDSANTVQDNFTMTWEQAKELVDRGHIIGSHTVNHPNLTRISDKELACETENSKSILELRLGAAIHHFSHPNPILEPHWNNNTALACKKAGYLTAVTSSAGFVTKRSDPFALPRQYAVQSFDEFVWNLELGLAGFIR